MSVLIKDMEMPESCKSCDLLQDYDGDMYCPLNDYLNFGDIENVPDYVMIGCHLSAQPEIIQCKDCKWKQGSECVRFAELRPFPDDFCSRGERRAYG